MVARQTAALFVALVLTLGADAQQRATAIFAGGCFWCMEPPYEKLQGVVSVTSGYTGGATKNPTYEEVSNGGTGHYEAVLITYDPRQVSYATLLEVFWRNVDPLDAHGQFCDEGDQYRSAIFYRDDAERRLAEQTKRKLEQARRWKIAERYHQDHYKKNPVRYKFYRFNCGRDHRLRQLWGETK